MGLKVIFLHYHGIGHINPCFPLARILLQHHYEVIFAGAPFFSDYVIAEGFNFYSLTTVPFGLGFENWANQVNRRGNIYLASLWDRIKDTLYDKREKELLEMLEELSPDAIFLDGAQSTDLIVLYQKLRTTRIRVAVLHAMFPSHVISGRPPANSDANPHDLREVSKAKRKMNWTKFKKSWIQKLKYLSFDDRLIIDRRIKKNRIPAHFVSNTPSLFNYNVDSIPEFILSPREFDYPDFQVAPLQHYIGFMMNPAKAFLWDDDYLIAKKAMITQKQTKNAKVIYCSFGTIEIQLEDVIIPFLRKIVHIVKQSGYILILSLGAQARLMKEIPGSDVHIFTSVPQLDVLTYTDLFITHGGLGSIKEAIQAGVPMLMYPIHPEFDPIGNSARVAYHQLGLRGSARGDDEPTIKRKIAELLSNGLYRENIKLLREKNNTYTAQRFMHLFNTIKPIP